MNRRILGDVASVALAIVALVSVGGLVVHEHEVASRVTEPHYLTFERHLLSDTLAMDGNGHWLGASGAKIKLVEFSDFQCPFCLKLDGILQELLSRHPGDVAILYRQFPLSIHRFARQAAIASECAADQHEFPGFASLLFAKHDSVGTLP